MRFSFLLPPLLFLGLVIVSCGSNKEKEDTDTSYTPTTTTTTTWSGTQQLGTSTDDYGDGVTVDSSNNIYVMGFTEGGLDGNTSLEDNDLILVKYNSSGTKQWTKQLGTPEDDRGRRVTVDSSKNIYVTGYTSGGLDGNTNSGNTDLILVKYNSSRTKQFLN